MTRFYTNHPSHSKVYREPLRVGTVAGICRVTNKTIFNWINCGALKSFTTRGGHNRVWPADLREFLDRAGTDIEFEFEDKRQTRFLLVNERPHQGKLLRKSLCDRFPHASVVATQNEYEALLLVGEKKPHVVIWDLNTPRFDRVRIMKFLLDRRMNTSIHATLDHYINGEELKWHAYSGATQEEKMGTGLEEMLNSLQSLHIAPIPPSSRRFARQA
jgi:hypothetical protein